MRQGVDFILEALTAEGVDHLFMVPGGLVDPFFCPRSGRQTALTPIVAAQEGGAAYMADGYARAKRQFWRRFVHRRPGPRQCGDGLRRPRGRTDPPFSLMSGEVSTSLEGRRQVSGRKCADPRRPPPC